jgi:hypothetical protein
MYLAKTEVWTSKNVHFEYFVSVISQLSVHPIFKTQIGYILSCEITKTNFSKCTFFEGHTLHSFPTTGELSGEDHLSQMISLGGYLFNKKVKLINLYIT